MRKLLLALLGVIVGLFVLINVAIFAFGHDYIYKALRYGQPGIDDLAIFPYRTIGKSSKPLPWPVTDQQRILPQPLREVLEEFDSVAFLVLQGGVIEYEEYWDGYTPERNSNSFSAAKSIVSALIGVAQAEGLIKSLVQPVADYLPRFAEGEKARIRIVDVLRMASGLNFEEHYTQPFTHTTEAYYGSDLPGLVNRLTVKEPPGVDYEYRSGDTQVLAMIVEAATGKTLADYAQEKLWEPLGAVNDAQWSLDADNGHEKAYCCFYSNARDFARVGQLWLHKGRFNGQQLVPETYVRESITPHGLINDGGKQVDYYGYQWWMMNRNGVEIYYARGILGQYIMAIPDLDMVVVRLGHKRSAVKENYHPTDVYRIIDGVLGWGLNSP